MEKGSQRFVVFKSSAGSGKTYTLVREYLKILLRDPDAFRHVLAVTFTNKAANEMKERIIRYLKTVADPVSHPDNTVEKYLLPELMQETGFDRDALSKRAYLALRSVMHQYADFSVGTIDSFFHRVVKTFAHDLNIPLSFEVILEEKDVLEEVVSLLLTRVGTDDDLTRTLVRFIQKKAEDEKSWDIEKDLVRFSEVLTRESAIPFLQRGAELENGKLENARQTIWRYIADIEKDLRGRAQQALDLLNQHSLEAALLAGGSKGLMPWLSRLSAGVMQSLKIPSAVLKAYEKGAWHSSKASRDEKALIGSLSEDLDRVISPIINSIEQEKTKYLSYGILLKYLYQMAVLNALEKELQEYREENNILLISEFNRRIHNIVREQPVPFIYERLGERYRHFLVDEFQDTSVLQWHNILPLVENSLSEGRLNMVVGDGKQAIYRFRAGDVRQFEKLPYLLDPPEDHLMKAREEALARNFDLKVLKDNFRSREAVVSLNNRFFYRASQWFPEELGTVYSDVKQGISGEQGGYVRLEFIEAEDGSKAYKEQMMKRVLEIVELLLSQNFRQKDIAILCRDNLNASHIAAMLLSHGKQVVSADSLALSYSAEVNFLIAWMRHLSNPSDEIAPAHIMTYLMKQGSLPLETIENYLLDSAKPDRRYFPEESASYTNRSFQHLIQTHYPGVRTEELLRTDLYHLAVELVRYFMPGFNSDPYIQFFLDQVLDFMKKEDNSIPGFLKWWDDKGSSKSIVTPDGLDAIRVMTIHKSKGLEFPIVIYPFADQKLRLTLNQAWVNIDDRNLKQDMPFAYIDVSTSLEGTGFEGIYMEERAKSLVDMYNIAYVAMTRARDQLFLLSRTPPKDSSKSDSLPKMLRRFLVEEGEWQEGKMVYEYGASTGFEGQKVDIPAGTPVFEEVTPFPDWRKRILLRSSAPESWEVDDPDKSTSLGNIVHYLLSEIRSREDRDNVLHKGLNEGIIDESEFATVSEQIDRVLTDPKTSCLFDPELNVRTEAEILTVGGSVFRPDRIIMKDRKVRVIDFKTGRQADHHLQQVNEYAGLMREMGYEVEEALIIYIGKEIIVIRA